MTQLTGQVAPVTGASRGVGRGVALGLAGAGARVFATGRSIARADLGPRRPATSIFWHHFGTMDWESR
jgi:NAD(P)-dependent dehydrogenase (short-subunit alcohol dehydrogenase family)